MAGCYWLLLVGQKVISVVDALFAKLSMKWRMRAIFKTKSKLKTNSTCVLSYITQNSSLKTQNLWDPLSENLFGWVLSFCFYYSYLKFLSYENENWELLWRCFKFLRNEFDGIFVNKCILVEHPSMTCHILAQYCCKLFSSLTLALASQWRTVNTYTHHSPLFFLSTFYFLEPLLQFQLPHSLISPTSLNLI